MGPLNYVVEQFLNFLVCLILLCFSKLLRISQTLFECYLSIFTILEIRSEGFSRYLLTHLKITIIYQAHANISNIFMEDRLYFPKQKIIEKSWHHFTFL